MKNIKRCPWAVVQDPLYIAYHDQEWGVPLYDDQKLFEFLILEGMQAGLSWSTILKKRENYRNCFHQFDAGKIAQYNQAKIEQLLKNPGIIRNRLKIEAIVKNARVYLQLQQRDQFSNFLWKYVNGVPLQNHWQNMENVPTKTAISDQMAKDLKHLGFKFVGTTICYALMQATGMVNDHLIDCFRYSEIATLSSANRAMASRKG